VRSDLIVPGTMSAAKTDDVNEIVFHESHAAIGLL